MKIKNQISILIAGIIILPILCLILFPVYAYFSSPKRFLMKGYEQIRAINEQNLSEDDWDKILTQLEKVPPEVELMIYYDSKVMLSTIPEIESGAEIAPEQIFDFVQATNDTYDYQFQSLFVDENVLKKRDRRFGEQPEHENPPTPPTEEEVRQRHEKHEVYERKKRGLIISRLDLRPHPSRRKIPRFIKHFFWLAVVFEAFTICVIVLISKSISRSIEVLQAATKKIADGELETNLNLPKKTNSNEILMLTEDLERMRNSLKEDQQRRSRFIMGVSHDLRTPVALIKGYAEAISDGVVTGEAVAKSSAIIGAKTEQLEGMIDDLINYVKINNSEWLRALESVDIKEFLEEFAKNMEGAAELYKRHIVKSIDIQTRFVTMDKNLFQRAMENLFSNALQYTKEGDRIALEVHTASQGQTEITLSDSGIGIPEEDQKKVFELFFRATNSRRESGTGIGLSVVKTIVDAHGWKIELTSHVAQGSAFKITIP